MANSIIINKGPSGLGAPLTGEDFVSGYIHYSATIPSGFASTPINALYSVTDAEDLGIVSGTGSDTNILHYHISEFFRIQPKGELWVGCYASPASGYADITTVQNFAGGKIRQMGVWQSTSFLSGNVTALQAQATSLYSYHKPLEIIYQPNFKGATLSTLTDLGTLAAPNVSICIGQDGGNVGKDLYEANGKTVGCLGTTLGCVSLANVNESIAWVGKFNMAGTEFDTLAFADGTLYSSLTDAAIDAIDTKRYIFLKKHVGLAGSYFDNPYTAISATSDYAKINNNRVINKAARDLYTYLLPNLASPVTISADGTLDPAIVSYFETVCARALDNMVRNKEISAFKVFIDPTQDFLSTSNLIINVQIIPVGSADTITVNLGFVLSIS